MKQALGDYLGKGTILFFWLGIEYIFLQLHWPASSLYLGDALYVQKNWIHWNIYTGYLGASFLDFWINLFLYYSYFKTGKINWYLFILFLVSLAGPVVFSSIKGGKTLDRETMISFYKNGAITAFPSYEKQGEILAKASAWVSVVILVVAFVRNKTNSK